MLKPKYLEHLPDRMVEMYAEVETDILCDMARRISAFDDFIPAAQWQYRKLIEMGNYHSFIMKALAARTGETERHIKKLMDGAGVETLRFDDAVYAAAGMNPPPIAASPALRAVLAEGLRATMGLFENLTRTTANTATGQFERALDRAWLQVQSGAFSVQEATAMAVKDLCRQGVGAIRYPSGHVDKLDTAVRRAVLTGVNQAALRLQEARLDEMGCDLVEVSAHSGARTGDGGENPSNHAWWQGKVYSRSGKHDTYPDFKTCTGYGTGEGLGGWNCRHSFFPFYEGVSERAYTDEELEELNVPKYPYNGKLLTEYEATQRQRYLERQIRRWKREKKAMESAGMNNGEASTRLKKWQAAQRDFLKQTGLKRRYDRERVENSRGVSVMAAAPNGPSGTGGALFEPDTLIESALKRLENSSGLGENINVLKYYAKSTIFEPKADMSGVIGYSPKDDIIYYKPNVAFPEDIDQDGILFHELAHRADFLIFHAAENLDWQATISRAAVQILNDQIISDNPFISDIISALSKGAIETLYSHSADYWKRDLMREREIFADLAALDALYGAAFFEGTDFLKGIYTMFKKIILGEMM